MTKGVLHLNSSMKFEKEYLDLILVPSGIFIMIVYHLILLCRCICRPHTTVVGYENNDKRAWVERIMKLDKNEVNVALSVISSNTSASTFLASVSLTLSSLIGAWMSNRSGEIFQSSIIYGDTRSTTMTLKYVSLLACFLLAFSCFLQSTMSFVHANYLITMPFSNVPVKNVERCVIRGGHFWTLGLRAIYFAINLLMWFFGPIPMFVASLVMVVTLSYLDTNTTPLHQHRSPDRDQQVPNNSFQKARSF